MLTVKYKPDNASGGTLILNTLLASGTSLYTLKLPVLELAGPDDISVREVFDENFTHTMDVKPKQLERLVGMEFFKQYRNFVIFRCDRLNDEYEDDPIYTINFVLNK